MAEPTPGELRLLELAARMQLAQEAAGPESASRRRIGLLLDPDTFVETGAFTVPPAPNPALGGRRVPGDGVVTGSGLAGGRPVFVFAQEPAVFGGSLGEVHADKIAALVRSAVSAGAPIVGLYDSEGVRLEEGVSALAGASAVSFELARAAGWVPRLAATFRTATEDATALLPALADFTFAMDDLAGKHDVAAGDEAELLASMRELLALLPSNRGEAPPCIAGPNPLDDVKHSAGQMLDSLLSGATAERFDMLAAVTGMVDDGTLLELQPRFAASIVTAFARLGGRPVAILANQPTVLGGALDGAACAKAERFVRFANSFGYPLLVFVNTAGAAPGTEPEAFAALHQTLAQAVIRLTVTIGRGSGLAAAVLNPRPLHGGYNLLHLAWPSAELAAASPEGAVDRLHRHEFEATARTAQAIWPQGKPFSEEDRTRILTGLRAERLEDYRARFANPWAAAERGYVDAVIHPSETRRRLLHALDILRPAASRKADVSL